MVSELRGEVVPPMTAELLMRRPWSARATTGGAGRTRGIGTRPRAGPAMEARLRALQPPADGTPLSGVAQTV